MASRWENSYSCSFSENEKEPLAQELQESLYTCFRKNPARSLNCYDDAMCYIGQINKSASVSMTTLICIIAMRNYLESF